MLGTDRLAGFQPVAIGRGSRVEQHSTTRSEPISASAGPTATEAEVEAAVRRALVAEFVPELPDGLDTVIGERGATLSGGQRQRIAIARALLKDAPILVMDEAVSNLDTENEQALHAAMAEIRRGRTTLLIAHRLSTIRSADLIVTLAEGRVAEAGRYDELVRAGGTFARLVAAQRRGRLER